MALIAGATSDGGAAVSIVELLTTTADPSSNALTIPAFFELGAVVAGAISGALEACNKRLDIIGVCVLGLITALGGGLIRDMILPTDQIYMLDNPVTVLLTTAVGIAAFFFSGLFYKLDKPIAVFDIISVALFTFSGTDKALLCGYGLIPCVFMGVITGVGGGLVRDVCLGRIPNIFRSSNFYAICSLAGAVVYFALVECHVVKIAAAAACVVVVVGLRWVSLRYNLITAVPVDLTPKLMGPLGRFMHRRRERMRAQMREGGPERGDQPSSAADSSPAPASASSASLASPASASAWGATADPAGSAADASTGSSSVSLTGPLAAEVAPSVDVPSPSPDDSAAAESLTTETP